MGIIGLDIVGTQVNCSFCIFWFFLAEIEFLLPFSISSQLICGVQITNIYLRSTGQVSITRQLTTLSCEDVHYELSNLQSTLPLWWQLFVWYEQAVCLCVQSHVALWKRTLVWKLRIYHYSQASVQTHSKIKTDINELMTFILSTNWFVQENIIILISSH